jgi:DNA-binding MarR family transcriptional regulator
MPRAVKRFRNSRNSLPATRSAAPAVVAAEAPVAAAGQPTGCTNFKLHQLGRRVARLYDVDVRALGLKGTQYSLLSHVVRLGPIQPSALAARMQLDPSTLTRNLQPLVAQGWVEVVAGNDARSRQVRATDTGRALREQAQRAWKRSQLALNTRLGTARVHQLHTLIDECMALLDEAVPADAADLQGQDTRGP